MKGLESRVSFVKGKFLAGKFMRRFCFVSLAVSVALHVDITK